LLNALFADRLVFAALESNDFCPRHDELLLALAKGACPPVAIESPAQSLDRAERFHEAGQVRGVPVVSDEGAGWIVEFRHEGRPDRFRATCKGSYLDLEAVLRHFDALLESLGRADRAFELGAGPGRGADWGIFLVADAQRFEALMGRLRLPVRRAR
jgi:hypothetical protein